MSISDSPRILVSGASERRRKKLLAALSSCTAEVISLEDDAECVAQVKAHPQDLVIWFMGSDDPGDFCLLKEIHQIRPETRVIIVADETPADAVILAMREHAFALFNAGYEPAALTMLVNEALAISNWEDGIEVKSARPEWISLRLRCRMLTAERLLQFMRNLRTGLEAEERENIATAFREMLLNAIEHGAGLDPDKWVHVSYLRTKRVIIYQIRDPGEGFSFEDLPHAAISNETGDPMAHMLYRMEHGIRSGGFGILIVRNLVDELLYNESGNEVTMIKYL